MAEAKTGTTEKKPGTTAATLEEARDPARWGRAADTMLVLFAPKVGKQTAEELLGRASLLAVPPNGEDPWPFATGRTLEAHLETLMERCRSQLRRDPNRKRWGGSTEKVENSPSAASLSPEQRTVSRDLLRQTVVAIRERFAEDREVLAYFEYLLRPTDENKAALPVGTARYQAHDRFTRFVTPLRARLADESRADRTGTE